ncbi:MAG: hypothetical protein WAL63_11155 [Solirubrobacteraceae bacterium]
MRPSRLRAGEIIAAVSALVLLVAMFGLAWLALPASGGARSDVDGWTGLPVLRWFLAVSALAGLALAFLQAARRAPALPVVMSVIVTPLAGVTTLLLIVRLLTWNGALQAGAYVGLLAVASLAFGGFRSLREEGGWLPGRDRSIETIAVAEAASDPGPT